MRYKVSISAFLASLLFLAIAVSAQSDDTTPKRHPRMRMIGHLLNNAGCPLDEAQIDQIKNLEREHESREQFLSILTDEQKEALNNVRGNRGKRAGNRMMGRVLENAGYPLDESQIEQIKNLERGPESREQFLSILTDEQEEALNNARGNRGKRAGNRLMRHVLENAGCPLDETQIDQIKNLERGPESREQFLSILTDEQKEALKNARKRTHRGAFRRPKIGKILESAGCPFTEEQVSQLKSLKPGPERREQVESILTDEQKAALANHFENVSIENESQDTLEKPVAHEEQPESFNILKQNYPNPFNPSTTIEYQIKKPGNVTIEIYGPNGQLVSTLVNDYQNAGWHSVTWDASSQAGGVYVCKIMSGDYTESQKMTFVK